MVLFFDSMSQQVNTDVNHIAALAALESNWGLHRKAIARNNIWGMLRRGQIGNLLVFRRVNPYDYWVKRFGPYANGAQNIEQFGKQLKSIYAPEDKGWFDALVNRHKLLELYRKACNV